jgi:hypothetical protein
MTVQFREYFAVAYTFSSTRGPLRGRCDLCRLEIVPMKSLLAFTLEDLGKGERTMSTGALV